VQSNSWYLQVGADNGDSFRKDAQTPWGVGGALDYLLFVDVTNADSAQRSISVADKAIGALSNALSIIGRQERVLNHIANDTAAQIIGIENSKSAIFDADIASEALSLTKENILAQSATSVLAQSSSINGSTVLDLIDMSLA
ncbi:MAG TPA: flagellin, partial [bacterium]|nr:flagellin [bacterium]